MNAADRKRLRAAVLRHAAQGEATMNAITLGADLGNATVSVATVDGSVVFFPSFVATMGVRTYSGKGNARRHHISMDGINVLVGVDAIDAIGTDTLMADAYTAQDAFTRYLDMPSLYALLAGVAAAASEDHLTVNLGTGAPLSIFEPHGETIAAHFRRRFDFTYNGRDRSVTFANVQVYGEGMEAIRLLPEAQQAGNVAIHDIGGRTWNTLLFKDGALRAYRTHDLGVERLLSSLPALVSTDSAVRWAMQAEMRANAKSHPDVRVAMAEVVKRALKTIERKVNLPAADRHVLLGGGAVYLPAVIKAVYNKPVLTLNDKAPEAANAIAYAKAASEVF